MAQQQDELHLHIQKYEDQLERLRHESEKVPVIELTTDEYGPIFEAFPHLHKLLSEKLFQQESNRGHDSTALSTPKKSTTISPRKRVVNQVLPSSMPEHEWVLRMQPAVEHKMFDSDIADLIDTEILTSPSKRKEKLSKVHNNKQNLIDYVRLENVYRMTGITVFPVVDPSDLKVNKETKEYEILREMMGIRLEVFNEVLSTFEKPYYVLLKKSSKRDSWDIFKHTVPNYIDIQLLFEKTNGGIIADYSSTYLFAKKVYQLLLQTSLKAQVFEVLAREDSRISQIENDLAVNVVSFKVSFKDLSFKTILQMNWNNVQGASIKLNSEHVRRWENYLLGPVDEFPRKLAQVISEVESIHELV